MKKAHKRQLRPGDKTPGQPEKSYWQLFDKMHEGFISAEVIRDDAGAIVDWYILIEQRQALETLRETRHQLKGTCTSRETYRPAVSKGSYRIGRILFHF